MEQTPVLIEKYRGFEIYFLPDDNEFYADIDYGQSPYNRYEWETNGVKRKTGDIVRVRRTIDERHDSRVCYEWNPYGLTTRKMMPDSNIKPVENKTYSHHAYTNKVSAAIKSKEAAEKEDRERREREREESRKILEMLEPFDYESAQPYYPPIDEWEIQA